MITPAQLFDDFNRDGWKSEPFDRMLELAKADPGNAFRLLELALERGGKSHTFIDAAVSFVHEDLLPELAHQAAPAFLRDRKNDVAENVLAYLSLQANSSLQPFLREFLSAPPNATSYYSTWPWRSATPADVEQMLAALRAEKSADEKQWAFQCLLETRNPEYLRAAVAAIGPGELRFDPSVYLAEVGYDGVERKLFSERAFHIRFPLDLFNFQSRPVWLEPENHPTWSLPAAVGKHRFGGVAESTCAVCNGPLHNLLTLDPVPSALGLDLPGRLQIATCLSCLGWSRTPLFFQHDDSGTPIAIPEEPQTPEFPSGPLQEIWVELSPTPPRWQWQDWGLSNSRENLHRLGGHPTWIQSAEYATCPTCERVMPFLLQLDSNLPTQGGGEWLWGSGGGCYVFWCGSCRVSAMLWQCT